MDHRDRTGIVAACLALALASGVWLVDLGKGGGGESVADRVGLDLASVQALESHSIGEPLAWQDRRTGAKAVITPASAYRDGRGRWCRAYSLAIATGMGVHQPPSRHVACRDGNGRWARLQAPHEQVAGH